MSRFDGPAVGGPRLRFAFSGCRVEHAVIPCENRLVMARLQAIRKVTTWIGETAGLAEAVVDDGGVQHERSTSCRAS